MSQTIEFIGKHSLAFTYGSVSLTIAALYFVTRGLTTWRRIGIVGAALLGINALLVVYITSEPKQMLVEPSKRASVTDDLRVKSLQTTECLTEFRRFLDEGIGGKAVRAPTPGEEVSRGRHDYLRDAHPSPQT